MEESLIWFMSLLLSTRAPLARDAHANHLNRSKTTRRKHYVLTAIGAAARWMMTSVVKASAAPPTPLRKAAF